MNWNSIDQKITSVHRIIFCRRFYIRTQFLQNEENLTKFLINVMLISKLNLNKYFCSSRLANLSQLLETFCCLLSCGHYLLIPFNICVSQFFMKFDDAQKFSAHFYSKELLYLNLSATSRLEKKNSSNDFQMFVSF